MRPSIFISVSNREHSDLRNEVRNALAGSFDVVVEPDFPAMASDSIRQLDQLISPCQLLVHIVGNDLGTVAKSHDVDAFTSVSAFSEFIGSKPELFGRIGDVRDLTYPQWEVLLALFRQIPVVLFKDASILSTGRHSNYIESLRFAGHWARPFKVDTTPAAQIVNDVHHHFKVTPELDLQTSAVTAIDSANKRFLSASNRDLINGQPIPRNEVAQIVDALTKDNKPGVILVAEAGFGKSCILAQILEKLTASGIPVLAFKLDALPECGTANKLGRELELPADPVTCINRVSGDKPRIIIVDQLDAISTVSGRRTISWDGFDEIRQKVFESPEVKLIVACRGFDLEQDQRLRVLENQDSVLFKICVSRLSKPELRSALDRSGLDKFQPNESQTEILSLPLHLALFLEGYPTLPFSRIGDLYERYWKRKRNEVQSLVGHSDNWTTIIETVCDWMSEHQSLTCPQDTLDEWADTAKAMASLHVLVPVGKEYRFFHESFFDYAYARCFCISKQNLLSFLTKDGEEQQLFRRAQVRQVLGYRREHRFAEYLTDLKDMLGSERVRFNIRRMVATTLRQVDKPTEAEFEIIEPFLFDHDLSNALAGSLRGSLGWFDLLLTNGKLAEWLNSEDDKKVNLAIWINCRIDFHDSRSEQIAQLMSPFLGRDEAWNRRFRELFSWGIAHKSQPMWELYLRLFELGGFDDAETNGSFRGVWAKIDNAAEEAPRRVIDLVEAWLKRAATQFDDGETKYFFEQCQSNRSDDGCHQIREAVHREPAYFLKRILPLFVDIVRRTAYSFSDRLLNRAWPFLHPHFETYKIDDAILHELCR